MTTSERKLELLRRAGKDPVILDTRPLREIMNDCIPYDRWEREQKVIVRAGYRTWEDLLKARHDAKVEFDTPATGAADPIDA